MFLLLAILRGVKLFKMLFELYNRYYNTKRNMVKLLKITLLLLHIPMPMKIFHKCKIEFTYEP